MGYFSISDGACFCSATRHTMADQPKTLFYKRVQFVTHLPMGYLYSQSHAWVAREDDGEHWRVGLTKFATRMLGEMVDHGFEVRPGEAVEPGQIVGWVEGFKAISDVYCIARGKFAGSNPALTEKVTLISKDPYGAGWLYRVKGQADSACFDVHGYRAVLDSAIDRILAKQEQESK
jgi:glycine cleavage system H protein